jgi:pantoate--beta-alanine ligase
LQCARGDNATVCTTIFVNPTQFGPHEDFERYPRPIENDLALLAEERADVVFTPTVEEMYGAGFATTVHVEGPSRGYEGQARPGHFDGVATIVMKLFLQSLPDVAYFGQKDAQQVAVIRRLVRDLNIPVELRVVPTVRDHDGLAVSSRNVYLTPEERVSAPVLFRALSATRDRYRSGVHHKHSLESGCWALLQSERLVRSVDYVAAVDADTFEPWNGQGPCLLAAAVRIGSIRLIDNVMLD